MFEKPLKATKVTKKYRFHLLGLVHLPVSEEYMGCAFTQKIVKLSKMLLSLGHEVYIYGSEGSDAPCTEFIQTHTLNDIRGEWGEGDNRFDIGYDWETKGFKHDFNADRTATWYKYNAKAIKEINRRKRDDDFILIMQGQYQRPVAEGANLFLTCEPGIGYRGSMKKLNNGRYVYRAFESSYLMNFTYGSAHPFKSINGSYYDRVIPNYFESEHFPFKEKKDDYFFFIGRMISRKGVMTAIKACEAAGEKLILAGQSKEVSWDYEDAKYVGYVNPEQRAKYLSNAKGVFVPTEYLEAFGGVNVEAQLCGTPVITTNFSVFPETVINGVTGYRCDTLQDFVDAVRNIDKIDNKVVRKHAERYLTDNVKWEFQKWFDDLYQVYLSSKQPGVVKGWSKAI